MRLRSTIAQQVRNVDFEICLEFFVKSVYEKFLNIGSKDASFGWTLASPSAPSLLVNFLTDIPLFPIGFVSALLALIFFLRNHLFLVLLLSFIAISALLGLLCILLNGDYNNNVNRDKFRRTWFFIIVMTLLGLFLFNFLAAMLSQPLVLTIGAGILFGLTIGAFILVSGERSFLGTIFGTLTDVQIDSFFTSPSLFKAAKENTNRLFSEVISPVLPTNVQPDENGVGIGVFFFFLTVWLLSLYGILFEKN